MSRPTVLAIGGAAVVLGVATSAMMAVATGGPAPAQPVNPAPASCTPPALSGAVVDVTLTDMGGMMDGGMMGPGMMGPGMMGGGMMSHGMPPMMRITASPNTVHAGQVSLRVVNSGSVAHEVVVMPLAAGQYPGQRPIGADGEVDEAGSLGEAALSCGAGEGDGIAPGSASWTTLTLPAGRYELLCNISGHYGSGMYTELDVTPA